MNSMEQLNGFGNISQIYQDDRNSSVTFSAVTSPLTIYKPDATLSIPMPVGVEILSAQAISDASNLVIQTGNASISIDWPTVPDLCNVSTPVGNTYRITGPFLLDIWGNIKQPDIDFAPGWRGDGPLQANLTVPGYASKTYTVNIETDPLLDANFYVLDSSGNYTGNVAVANVYYNQLPYLDVIAEGTGNASSNNAIANITVAFTHTGVDNWPILEHSPLTISAPTGGLGRRYQNYLKAIGFVGPLPAIPVSSTANITATTTAGRSVSSQKTIQVFNDIAEFNTSQTDWVTGVGGFIAGYNQTNSATGSISGGTWTAQTQTNDIDLFVNHYPQFGYGDKWFIFKTILISYGTMQFTIDVQNGDTTSTGDGADAWYDTAFTLSINGDTLYTKPAGTSSLDLLSPAKYDFTDLLTTTPTIVANQQSIPNFSYAWSVNNINTYAPSESTVFQFRVTMEGIQDYRYKNAAGGGPVITPIFDHSLSTTTWQVRWRRG